MANKDLVIKLTINSKDFEMGLKNAKSSMKTAEISIGSLAKSFAKFAGGLGLAVSAGSLFFDNLKDIETISDKVAKTQKVLNEHIFIITLYPCCSLPVIIKNFHDLLYYI